MKTYVLYLAACALHLVLLFLFSHLQLYRRHPAFMLWLLAAPLANLSIWVLYWAEEFRVLGSAQFGLDILWYSLLGSALVMAIAQWNDPTSAVLRRGILALLIFTVMGREAGRMHLAGYLGLALANILNATYLAPTLYMIVKLSGFRLGSLPLWLREDSPWVAAARHGWGFTRAILG